MTNIKFRMPAGTQFSLETSEEPSDLTISKLKELISGPDKADAPPSALKLVYRGKILKDENTLDSYGMSSRRLFVFVCLVVSDLYLRPVVMSTNSLSCFFL